MSFSRFFLLTLSAAVLLTANTASAQFGAARYRVSVTNITKGQILSPVVVATHTTRAEPLYMLGAPASDELAQLAEDAMLQPMIDKLSMAADVLDVQTITGVNGPILPGETAWVELDSLGQYNRVSLVGMLVTTNDTFVGLNGVRGPNVGSGVHMAPAYDAGTEANTEMCTDIPGPPCGNGGVRVTDGAEGYVYVSPGISGEGDLPASMYTWLNSAVKIVIERLRP